MKIYHYTDLNGLKGIIESGSLWATHFSFLNDSNELTHGMNCLENALQYLRDDFNPKTLVHRTGTDAFQNAPGCSRL
nr:hypothetical protein [Enterobacter huaxiensis]